LSLFYKFQYESNKTSDGRLCTAQTWDVYIEQCYNVMPEANWVFKYFSLHS